MHGFLNINGHFVLPFFIPLFLLVVSEFVSTVTVQTVFKKNINGHFVLPFCVITDFS